MGRLSRFAGPTRDTRRREQVQAFWDATLVTVTLPQVLAIARALNVVDSVWRHENYGALWDRDDLPDGANENDLIKSRLLGRLLLQGRPPTKTRPPTRWGGPEWSLLPGGDPFAD
jgi:hypothetical protein